MSRGPRFSWWLWRCGQLPSHRKSLADFYIWVHRSTGLSGGGSCLVKIKLIKLLVPKNTFLAVFVSPITPRRGTTLASPTQPQPSPRFCNTIEIADLSTTPPPQKNANRSNDKRQNGESPRFLCSLAPGSLREDSRSFEDGIED